MKSHPYRASIMSCAEISLVLISIQRSRFDIRSRLHFLNEPRGAPVGDPLQTWIDRLPWCSLLWEIPQHPAGRLQSGGSDLPREPSSAPVQFRCEIWYFDVARPYTLKWWKATNSDHRSHNMTGSLISKMRSNSAQAILLCRCRATWEGYLPPLHGEYNRLSRLQRRFLERHHGYHPKIRSFKGFL